MVAGQSDREQDRDDGAGVRGGRHGAALEHPTVGRANGGLGGLGRDDRGQGGGGRVGRGPGGPGQSGAECERRPPATASTSGAVSRTDSSAARPATPASVSAAPIAAEPHRRPASRWYGRPRRRPQQ